jgi:hypothetical protein
MARYRIRLISTAVISAVFTIGLATGWTLPETGHAQRERFDQCGPSSTSQLRTTLYFGTARPKGSVSELEWQLFLRDEVSSRFPDGLTVWDADGQWRVPGGKIEHERTKVLLLVHPDTMAAREAVRTIIARYRKAFDQQSVLWETARVCVAS